MTTKEASGLGMNIAAKRDLIATAREIVATSSHADCRVALLDEHTKITMLLPVADLPYFVEPQHVQNLIDLTVDAAEALASSSVALIWARPGDATIYPSDQDLLTDVATRLASSPLSLHGQVVIGADQTVTAVEYGGRRIDASAPLPNYASAAQG